MPATTLVSVFVIIAFVGFLLLTAVKASKYSKMATHSRFDLYPVPKEGKKRAAYGGSYMEEVEWWNDKPRTIDRGTETIDIFKEMFLIKKLYVNQRAMWGPSFIFHWGLYFLFAWSVLLLITVAWSPSWLLVFTGIVGVIGFCLATLGAAILLIRRITDEGLRVYTTPAEFFNLLLILAVLVTGEVCWTTGASPFVIAKQVFTMSATTLSPLMIVHFILLGFLLLYIPVSKMGHYVGKFYSFRSVLWDNDPNVPGSKTERNFKRSAAQKPATQWSAHMPAPKTESEE